MEPTPRHDLDTTRTEYGDVLDDVLRKGPRPILPDPGDAPTVLIVGGFMTMPPVYLPMRRRLLARGAAAVHIAPVWQAHWMLAGAVGLGPLLRLTGEAIARAYRAGGRRPIIVIGHSGGGILTRLAMSPVRFRGRIAAVSEAVGALVTLGSPHGMLSRPGGWEHAGHLAARFLAEATPGAYFLPRTGYLTVASRADPFRFRIGGRLRGRLHAAFISPSVLEGPGDGMVPAAVAHLEGARQITFDDVRHGHIGGPWYGDAEIIDRWWPIALQVWREALAARAAARTVDQ